MDILLDTTIQIDKILSSKKRKKVIRDCLQGKECYSSTYVLGEFYKNIVNDFLTMYSIIDQSDDLNEAERRCNEKAFARSQSRVHKLFIDLRGLSQNNIGIMKEMIDGYIDLLIEGFYTGINRELVNGTKCKKASARIVYKEGVPVLEGISCRATDRQCGICEFWKSNKDAIGDLSCATNLKNKVSVLLKGIKSGKMNVKGNKCMDLGDAVVAMEAKSLMTDKAVCSSNKSDFEPICSLFGVSLISPDYRD